MGDVPLDAVGAEQIHALVQHVCSRPKGPRDKPIAVMTVVTFVQHFRQFFAWLDDAGRWEAPRRFEKLFRVKRRTLMTQAERLKAAAGVETFTIDELAALYAAANSRQRLYILLALNCGFTQQEMAALRCDEIHELEAEHPYVRHARTKTGVVGRWELWRETALALIQRLGETPENDDCLALLSEDGNPLVHYGAKNKSDSVRLTWDRLLNAEGVKGRVRPLSFKYLRKTGSDLVRKAAGLEASQVYLAHAGKSVAERHYNNADFEKVAVGLRKLREYLQPMFDAAAKAHELAAAAAAAGEGLLV
jgi:integrase